MYKMFNSHFSKYVGQVALRSYEALGGAVDDNSDGFTEKQESVEQTEDGVLNEESNISSGSESEQLPSERAEATGGTCGTSEHGELVSKELPDLEETKKILRKLLGV